jgi:hypothetical protein
MINISYILGCRSCNQSDGIRTSYLLRGENNVNNLKSSREFELVKIIEGWRKEDDKTCIFCNSKNVEVYDVEVDGYRLYDFERLSQQLEQRAEDLLILHYQKRNNVTSLSTGGNEPFHRLFLQKSISLIEETVRNSLFNNMEIKSNGHFRVAFSGGFDFINGVANSKIERIQYSGFSFQEINNEINKLKRDFGF